MASILERLKAGRRNIKTEVAKAKGKQRSLPDLPVGSRPPILPAPPIIAPRPTPVIGPPGRPPGPPSTIPRPVIGPPIRPPRPTPVIGPPIAGPGGGKEGLLGKFFGLQRRPRGSGMFTDDELKKGYRKL